MQCCTVQLNPPGDDNVNVTAREWSKAFVYIITTLYAAD